MNMPGALADLRQAVELAPESARPRLPCRGAPPRQPSRGSPAPRLAHSAPTERPRRAPADGPCARNLAQPEEAGKILDDILIAEPNKVLALVERGRVALDLDHPDDAKRWLVRAYELAPDQREVLLALSDCCRRLNFLDDAKRLQDRAREIDERLQKRLDEMTGKSPR